MNGTISIYIFPTLIYIYIYIYIHIRFRPRGGSCATVTTPLVFNPRAFAHRMFGRLLAAWLWCDFIAHLSIQTGEAGGTKLASGPSTEKATSEILPIQGSHRFLGEKDKKESETGLEFVVRAPLLQSTRVPFPSPKSGCHDVALSCMQSKQHAKDDLLSGLPCSLECGLDSTATLQIQEHQEAKEGGFRIQGDRASQSREERMGSFPRKIAVDFHNAGKQSPAQGGTRNCYGQASWDASAASSSTSAICRSTDDAYSGGGKDVAASQRFAGHGHGPYGVNDTKIGGAFHEGSEGSIQSDIDPWTVEQAQQAQSAGGHSCTEDQGPGPGVDIFCQHYGSQGSTAWRNVPNMQSRSHGTLQCQNSGTGQCEAGDDSGIPIVVGTPMDRASHPRDARPRSAIRRFTDHHGDGGACRPHRSNGSHGGGGTCGARGHAAGSIMQSTTTSPSSLSWVKFAEQSGKPPSQGEGARFERQQGCQIQGQGERGQVMDTVALRGHGPCGRLGSASTSCSKLTSFRKQIKEFWHSHFGQPFSWNSDMSTRDDIMAPSTEDHSEVCSPMFSLVERQGNYECESLAAAHHNSLIHPSIQHHCNEKVEAKLEPLCYSDGSFDSLENMMQKTIEFGCDQANLDLIRPAQPLYVDKTILRDGKEGNMDLLASQVLNDDVDTDFVDKTHRQPFLDPSWCRCRTEVQGDAIDACQKRYNQKRVTFCPIVELHLEYQEQLCTAVMCETDACRAWRHLWHLHGQIAAWPDFQAVFANMADLNMIYAWSGTPAVSNDEELHVVQQDFNELADISESWWTAITQTCSQNDPRPEFIATWFLSPGRFHLCMRPRRVVFHGHMGFLEFEHACRETWKELMDGSHLRWYVVQGQPEGLPSTKAHVIIVQGDDTPWSVLLMKGVGLPPLMSTRAVLYAKECTVRAVFREAQYSEACAMQIFLCCIQYEQFGEAQQIADDDVCRVPQAQYVVGNLCPLGLSDEEDSGDASTASTDIPSDEDDDDSVSWLSSSATEKRTAWTWELHQGFRHTSGMDEPPARSHIWAHERKETKADTLWSWQAQVLRTSQQVDKGGGEGNVDLTWPADVESSSFAETDEIRWMSNRPIALQFERPDPYPWDTIEDADFDQEDEEIDDDVSFAHGHQDQAQAFLDQALEGLEESERRWVVVTYGLGLVDLGRRDTDFNPWRLHELEGKIRTLWEDHLRYGSLTIYHVTPQPCEVAGPNTLVVLVVIESPEDMNEDVRNVLVIQRGPRHLPLRPAPYGAKIFTDISIRDALVQLDMHKHCKPFKMRDCMIRLGYNVMELDQRYDVRDGMLCTVRVEDTPELVTQAGNIVDRVEDFYLQVEELQHMEGDIHQIICHVHGISPANRPLGWRQLILEGDDLLHLDWISQMQQLWPFAPDNARAVFCTMATDDLRDAEHIRFHFIVDYGGREGFPILVQQQIVSAQSMPYRSEGANEYWAISVLEGPVSLDIVTALAIHPFWFDYAVLQGVRPHVLVNGRRISGLQAMWQAGDFVHVRLQVWQNHHMLSIQLHEGVEAPQEPELEHTSFVQIRSSKSRSRMIALEPIGEICETLQVANWHLPEEANTEPLIGGHIRSDVYGSNDGEGPQDHPAMDSISEIQQHLRFVMSRGFEGIKYMTSC